GNSDAFDVHDFFLKIPMIAALLADLNPLEGGRIHFRQESDRFTITWDQVVEFGALNRNTVQLTLFADGSFSMAYKDVAIRIPLNGLPLIVGFNGGIQDSEFRAVNFSGSPTHSSNSEILFEDFDQTFYPEINLALTAQKFYSMQPDSFDQLVLMTNFELEGAPFAAFHALVQNDVLGIGREPVSHTTLFGSSGRLQSFIHMNDVSFWPDAPDPFFVRVLGHETEHRWGAFLHFNKDGRESELLLASDLTHWSYYLDTDGS
ncbi:hypothetical protein GWO43_12200, partial [candidate division KSB1 bacterium]|nr:hypothetical protein [candidate division KSB1 bacterium]NIR70979.1 hypothetical protein [candidate division KSB1 bacterium]NIS24720.1 hypothetical protein [candidate division KSB1 bacterium]NIT71624.1 hypothetical protein [candidate division KSB1 bacterium]NIU25331.1 hypothetical protein [candidate division KSB1 bacterium]